MFVVTKMIKCNYTVHSPHRNGQEEWLTPTCVHCVKKNEDKCAVLCVARQINLCTVVCLLSCSWLILGSKIEMTL